MGYYQKIGQDVEVSGLVEAIIVLQDEYVEIAVVLEQTFLFNNLIR